MQLALRVGQKKLEEFFSKVGKVIDVRMIVDNRSRLSKVFTKISYHYTV